MIDFGTIFGGFWEHFGDQNTSKNRVENLVFFGGQKMSPGTVCGDSSAASGYLEARRRAPGEAPECGGNPALIYLLAPPNPQQPINWWLWALGL